MAVKKIPPKENTFSIGYFPGLDILRFIAATGVIVHHTAQQLFNRKLISAEVESQRFSGSFFLNVFFIISGFLIASILQKEVAAGKFSLKNFYLRRIIRIWPLYLLAVLVFIIIIPMARHAPADLVKTNAFYAFTFTINFQLMFDEIAKTYAVLWSVCIEEHIYLLLPFFLLLFNKNFKVLSCVFIIGGFISWMYFSSVRNAGGPSPYYNSLCYFLFFGAGTLIASFHQNIFSKKMNFLFSVPAQLIVYALLTLHVFNFMPAKFYSDVPWLSGCVLFGSYLVAAASRPDCLFAMRSSVSRFAGNISYAMYVGHMLVLNLVMLYIVKNNVRPEGAIVNFWLPAVATLLSALLAAILYYLYERPILKLKGKFTVIANK